MSPRVRTQDLVRPGYTGPGGSWVHGTYWVLRHNSVVHGADDLGLVFGAAINDGIDPKHWMKNKWVCVQSSE